MIIYPAIDIRGGRCVRLSQGRDDAQTHYYQNPVEPAVQFAQAGAAWIHVVDLDGAFGGAPLNLGILKQIAALGPKIQFGGGMRSRELAEQAFAAGAERIVLGTRAATDPKFLREMAQAYSGQKLAVGIDAKDGSAATIQATGKIVETKHCKITECTAKDGKLTFTRLDERSPWPLSAEAVTAMGLLPMIADLSRYMLTVPGLPAGQYVVTMNGKPAATLSHTELANGWNMSTVREGPIAEQATKITGLISELQGGLNNVWRTASKAKDQAQLATAQKAIDENEVKLQAAVQPVAIQFEIAPAGAGKP